MWLYVLLVLAVLFGLNDTIRAESERGQKQLVLDFGDMEYPFGKGGKFDVSFVFDVDEQEAILGEEKGRYPMWIVQLRVEVGKFEIGTFELETA